MSAEANPRRPVGALGGAAGAPASPGSGKPAPERSRDARPFLLDFFPLEGPDQTRLSRFFDRLREGRLSTTRCPKDGALHWPPRTACPKCHSEELEWVDLPEGGEVYAFSAVLGGAPLGMEADVPFVVGLVDLDGLPLRLFGRIEGRPWTELRVGARVRVEPYELADGRVFYRFRSTD
ncbi:MAG: Zn-ribbon domain-containing OB-fold protein [Thermoplasmata archaeon]